MQSCQSDCMERVQITFWNQPFEVPTSFVWASLIKLMRVVIRFRYHHFGSHPAPADSIWKPNELPINKVPPSWLINLLHAWLAGCVWALRIHLVEIMQQFLYVECCCGWVEWMMSLRQMQRFFMPLLNASIDKKKMKNKLYFGIY